MILRQRRPAAAPAEFAETVRMLIWGRARQDAQQSRQNSAACAVLHPTAARKMLGRFTLKDVVFVELQDPDNSSAQFQALLEPLLEADFAPARDYAIGLLTEARPERRDYVLAVALGLAQFCAFHVWTDIWRLVLDREDIGEDLFLRLASRAFPGPFLHRPVRAGARRFVPMAERKFPHTDDPNRLGGMAHWVGPREMVADLRDGVLRHIIELGTDAGLKTLREIVAQRPDLTWLPLQLSRAEQIVRARTWTPLKPTEIVKVASSKRGRLVRSADDMCEILLESLRKYEAELHGEQTPVRSLWDRQADKSMRPVEEDALSDHVKQFLKRELADSGVVLNREVEVGRVPGTPVGTRTDIKIDAVRHGEKGEAYDAIVAVIETKGCWNPLLLTAIKTSFATTILSVWVHRLESPGRMV